MSDAARPFCLHFIDGRGSASAPGIFRRLTTPPSIRGLPVLDAIDYRPGLVAILQPYAEGMRDMTPQEVTAVRQWLVQLQAGEAPG